MKILFDEKFPKSLKKHFWKIHSVCTVQEMGWDGKRNGELLKLLLSEKFDVLITADKNLRFQQNLKKFPITVLLLDVKPLRPDTLEFLMPHVLKVFEKNLPHGLILIR